MCCFSLQRAVTSDVVPDCEVLFLREDGADVHGKAKPFAGGVLVLVVNAGCLYSDCCESSTL